MKQKIEFEIEIPEGKKAVLKDNKIVFEDVVFELPKTWKEFCDTFNTPDEEYYIDNTSEIDIHSGEFRDYDFDKNLLSSKEAAKAHLALIQLHRLRDCYRQGWKPDWKDDTTIKYAIVYSYSRELTVEEYSYTPMFLSFQSEELAKEFISNFRDLIEQAGDLI